MERTNKRQIATWMMVAILVLALAVIAAVGLNVPTLKVSAEEMQGLSDYPIVQVTPEMVPNNSERPTADIFPCFTPISYDKIKSWTGFSTDEVIHLIFDFDEDGFYYGLYFDGTWRENPIHETYSDNSTLQSTVRDGAYYYTANGGPARVGGRYLIGSKIIFETEVQIRYERIGTTTATISPGEYTVVTPEYDPDYQCYIFPGQFAINDISIDFSLFDRMRVIGNSFPVIGFTCISGDGSSSPYEFKLLYDEEESGQGDEQSSSVVRIGETDYPSLSDAFEASDAGDVLVLLDDIDISDQPNYITVDKSITIDLNGHTLNVGNSYGTPAILVGDNDKTNGSVVLSVINSVPADGGILGFCYVGQDDSYILFSDCRLSFTVEEVESTSHMNKIATGYEVVDIESTDPTYASGFRSVIRPEQHTHDGITFTPWESATSLPTVAGSYYLTADVTLASTWNVPVGTTNLCLNGHVIAAASGKYISVITVQDGSTLNLYDCDTTTHYYYVDASTYKQNRAPDRNKMYDIGEIAADGPSNSAYVASTKKGTFKGGYITGGTGQGLTSNSRNISGGGFQIYGGGTLNMYGGCVFGNYTSATSDQGNEGGGVYIYQNGVFNMYGGYIIGNQGGNACGGVQNLGTFTMNDGYIGHNTAGDGGWANGGAIGNSGTMTMNGGVIEGNEAGAYGGLRGKCGGAIENNGTLTINGGSIINNFCDNVGGAIYMSRASATLTIGAGAKIIGNYNDETKKADNIYLGANKVITLGSALTEKNSVGVTLKNGTGVLTSGWSDYMEGEDPSDYFVSDAEGLYFILNQDGEVEITDEAPPMPHVHDGVTFTAWESTNSLPTEAGNYYLTADVTLSSSWNVPAGETNLCLNGHGIKVTGVDSVIYIASGRTLNVYDCGDTVHYFDRDGTNRFAINIDETEGSGRNSFVGGYIAGGKGKDNQMHGGGVYVNGTFNLYGGNIIGNTLTASNNCGAGVYCNENSIFRMYGGSISYNYAQNAGCAIFGWKNCSIEIHGGEISYNKTNWSSGSAISFWNPTEGGYTVSLKLYGGFIHDNSSHGGAGAVDLVTASPTVGLKGGLIVQDNTTDSTAGNAALNVYVGTTPINIEGALSSDAKICIKLSSGTGVFTSGWSTYMGSADPADYFVSDDESYGVYLKDGEAAILEEAPPIPVSLGEGKLYVGGEDIVKADSYTVSGTGGGSAVYSEDEQGNRFLTLTDYVYEGPGYSYWGEGGGIDYRGGGTLTILLVGNSSITKADDSGIGRSHGIYLDNGTLIIDGTGSLTIGFADDRGGWKSNGIFNESGSFVMNGGTVVSNAGVGDESAGIYAGGGITFNGGNFTGNGNYTTDYESRGIYSGSITVNGGTVCGTAPLDNNFKARAFDGSVTINAGTLTAYGKVSFSSGVQCGANSTWTILAGDDEASATQVGGVDGNEKYVHISASTHVHNYSEDWSSDDTYHWHDCLNADCNVPEGSKAAHVYGDDISETTYYVCSVCEYENKDRKDEYEIYQTYGPVTKYELYVAGSQVTSAALSGEGWSYDPETNTLTLNNFTYEGEGADNSKLWRFNSVVTYAGEDPFNLFLVGENSITNTKDNYDYIMALLSIADLTISGNGSLTLSAPNAASTMSMGLCADADLYVNGGEITAIGGASEWLSAGICVWGIRYVQEGGSVFAQGGVADEKSHGLYVLGREQTSAAFGDDAGDGEGFGAGITIGAGIKNFVAVGHTSALYTEGGIDLRRGAKAWTDTDHASSEVEVAVGEYGNAAFATYKYVETKEEDSRWVIKMKAKSSVPSEYADFIEQGEKIVRVYDVTLYRIAKEGGEEQAPVAAQPSDIAAGMTITVKLPVPDVLVGKLFRILHVHAADDYAFVDFAVDEDGKHVTIRGIDRLSDFAFVANEADLNPSVPGSGEEQGQDPEQGQGGSGEQGGEQGQGGEEQGYKPFEIEPEITKEDDPTKDNLPLTPQGGQGGEEGQGGQGEEGQSGQGGKDEPAKPTASVALEDTDPEDAEGVTVEVEVKTEISEEVTQSENNVLVGSLQSDDEIAIVYDVKLIRTTIENGVEIREEIQPSDIKPGTVVVINMVIPEELRGKPFKLLHIHADDDIKEVTSYSISEDGATLTVRADRLSEFAFVGKKTLGGKVKEPNKIPDGAIAGIVIGASFGILLIGLLIFFLLKREKTDDGAKETKVAAAASRKGKKKKASPAKGNNASVSPVQSVSAVIVAPVVGATQNVGFYRITKDEEGKCTFALFYREGDNLSKEMGVFESEKAAYLAIKHLREKAVGAKAENRVKGSVESIPAPKFVLDVNEKGVYRYSFISEDGTVLLQSVSYLNEKRCLVDLKKTLNAVGTEEIVLENGELKEEAIDAVEETHVETVVEEVAATEIVEEETKEKTPVEEPEKTEEAGVSLKENIAVARAMVSHSAVNKQYIADYLKAKYAEGVELNQRGNETKTGLPLADTHYAVGEEKDRCFVYVYEIEGTTMLLIKVGDEYTKALAEKHPTVKRSAFPKSKAPWCSVIVDDTFTPEAIEKVLDDAYAINGGVKVADEGISLKETLAMAKATSTCVARTKIGIADFLKSALGDGVEINTRGNKTKTGLPLADTHYAVSENGKKCFIYVYETDAALVLLLRLSDEYAETVRAAGKKIIRSAFPKSKDSWYSIIVDDTYSEEDIQKILTDACNMAK